MILDILNNFIDYINNINNFCESYKKVINDIPNTLFIDKIFKEIQCKHVIYFSLLLFNFKCKFKHIRVIHSLYSSIIDEIKFVNGVVDSEARLVATGVAPGRRGIARIQPGFYDPALLEDITVANLGRLGGTPLNDDTLFEVIGLFTEDFSNANIPTKFDFTKIKGVYYIYESNLCSTYKELKKSLKMFFSNYKEWYDNFYDDIIFL
jgi:hypothetical protein